MGLRWRRELIVDIGSSHTVLASGERLLRVPSRVRSPQKLERKGQNSRAGELLFKTEAPRVPVVRGRVADVYAMELLLKEVLEGFRGSWFLPRGRPPAALLATPELEEGDITCLRAILVDVGFSRMELIRAPFAQARGCGLAVDEAEGQMVFDFGGGRVRFAVFSLGGLAAWWQEEIGGQDMDAAIAAYVAQRYRRTITPETAEAIKITLGSVHPLPKPRNMEISATELKAAETKKLLLSDDEIRDVLTNVCEMVLMGFQRGFADVPPELAGDIARNGIILVGGGALLSGLPEFFQERTGLRFYRAQDPFNAAVRGAGELLNGSRRHR